MPPDKEIHINVTILELEQEVNGCLLDYQLCCIYNRVRKVHHYYDCFKGDIYHDNNNYNIIN